MHTTEGVFGGVFDAHDSDMEVTVMYTSAVEGSMAYGFDLTKVTLSRFKDEIKTAYLIPSMGMLRENIDKQFDVIESEGVKTVSDLGKRLANQQKTEACAVHTGIDVAYLTALRRLVSSYKPKPRNLAEFPDIGDALLRAMANQGLKTSKTLFEYLQAEDPRDAQGRLGISETELHHVRAVMEVTQLRYVSPLFATAMVKSGHDSIAAVAGSERTQILKALITVNEEQNIYKGNIGDTDVQFLIDDARFFLSIQRL